MIVESIKFYPYELPLKRPLSIAGNHQTRKLIMVEAKSDCGEVGYGEIAPLEGLHSEAGIEASVHFGIETAILNLKSVFSPSLPQGKRETLTVRNNGLILESGKDALAEALTFQNSGYQTIKIKVGRNNVQEDIATLKSILNVVNPKLEIRLDANRGWCLSDALKFFEAIDRERISYIEEPVRSLEDLSRFYAKTGVPIALDETLPECNFYPPELSGVAAYIVRPSMIGSYERCDALFELARARGINSVITSSYESGFGLCILAKMAAGLKQEEIAHGLSTFGFLQSDVLHTKFPTKNGEFDMIECSRIVRQFKPLVILEINPRIRG